MSVRITPAEAADRLCMHRDTLLRMVRSKGADAPPAIWTGTRWLFDPAALDAWLAKRSAARVKPKVELAPRKPANKCRTYQPLPTFVPSANGENHGNPHDARDVQPD